MGRAWAMVLVMLICATAGAAANNLLTPIMATMLAELNMPVTYGGTLSSIFVGMNALASIPIGMLIQRFGIKKVGIVGILILLAGSIMGAFCQNASMLVVVRIIQGIGYTAPVVLSPIVLSQWFPEEKLSFPVGVAGAYAGLGSLVILQAANIAIPMGGWRAVFIAVSIIVAVSLVLFMTVKEGPYAAKEKKAEEDAADKPRFRDALKIPQIWLLILIYFCCGASMKAFFPFSAMIYTDLCGVDPATANNLASIFSFGMIFAGAIGGAIVSMAGKKRGIAFAIVIMVGICSIATGFWLSSPTQAWIFVIVAGFTTAAIPPLATAAVPDVVEDKRLIPVAMSLFLCIGQFVAGMVGPIISSFAQQIGGSWNAAGYPVILFAIICSACAIIVGRQILKKDAAAAKEEAKEL